MTTNCNLNLLIPDLSARCMVYNNSTLITLPYTLVGNSSVNNFTNKTITDPTNQVAANMLRNGTHVSTLDSVQPTTGYVLTATSPTALSWQPTQSGTVILPSQSQEVYVNVGGSDTTGVGTVNSPYATVAHALSTITDSSPTKRYTIILGPGNYTDNFSLKANVAISGSFELNTRLGGTIDLNDPSWNDPSGSNDNRSGFSNLALTNTTSGSLNFNYETQQSGAGKLYFETIAFNASPTFTGFRNINQNRFTNCFFGSGYTSNGCSDLNFQPYIEGAVVYSSNPNCNSVLEVIGGALDSTFTANWVSTGLPTDYQIQLSFKGLIITGTCTLNGSGCISNGTSSSFTSAPVLTSGAVFTYITSSLTSSYTPSVSANWTVVPTTVAQALDMISAKIGPV
jgi:hypothetical protein